MYCAVMHAEIHSDFLPLVAIEEPYTLVMKAAIVLGVLVVLAAALVVGRFST